MAKNIVIIREITLLKTKTSVSENIINAMITQTVGTTPNTVPKLLETISIR